MDLANLTCGGGVSLGPAQLLLTQLISTMLQSYCNLYPSYPLDQSPAVLGSDQQFDFIVVGAGSAGSAIAGRLSEVAEWRILLIEAGPDPPMETNIPTLQATLFGTKYDWAYHTEKSDKSCRRLKDENCLWAKGKMLGGSSSTDHSFYARGLASDYNKWEHLGNPGWSYKNVLKYFKKLEATKTSFSVPEVHGYTGKVHVQEFTNYTVFKLPQVAELLTKAFVEFGYPYVADMAAYMKSGITNNWGTTEGGVRDNAARAYLAPIKDLQNFVVMKETRVTRLLIDKAKRVHGVEVNKNGVYKKIYCSKEVILAAGAVGSPQIMMLSGIGPKEHLEELQIPVVVDLKVGYNLQDHIMQTGIIISFNISEGPIIPTDIFYRYLTRRTELGSFTINLVAFIDTLSRTTEIPDIQYLFGAVSPSGISQLRLFLGGLGYDPTMLNWFEQVGADKYLVLPLPILLRPASRGRIMLHSVNPLDPPKIITGYLEHDEDVNTLIRALKFTEKLMESKALRGSKLLYVPIAECERLIRKSDKFYECYIRNLVATAWHVSGSCKMGPPTDVDAVVDSRLKVYRVKGLRVGDTSIMPEVVSGNTNVPAMMIGEKIADMIKEDWLGYW